MEGAKIFELSGTFVAIFAGVWVCVSDLRTMRIPNRVLYPSGILMMACFGVAGAVQGDLAKVGAMLISVAGTWVLLLLIVAFTRSSLGFGDVKLAAWWAIPLSFYGWETAVQAVVVSLAVTLAVGVWLLVSKRVEIQEYIPVAPLMSSGPLLILALHRLTSVVVG